jgi:nucleoside-diphosphate-sugar epimerase
MKVFLIGGTGFLGTLLIPKFKESGHEVTVLTRDEKKVSRIEYLGSDAMVGDLLQPDPILERIPPFDAVISIAMPELKPGRISKKKLQQLQEETKSFFSTPIAIAEKCKCPLVVTLGTSFTTRGEEIADESWPIERLGIARVGKHVDPLLSEVTKRGSPPLIQMLPGQIYGPGGLFKRTMYEWMKKGKYRIVGSGDNYIPRIHVDDCAEAYVHVLEKIPTGERFIIRTVLGKLLYETITMNCRVSNANAKKHLDWHLKYPTYRDGLPPTIKKLKESDVRGI